MLNSTDYLKEAEGTSSKVAETRGMEQVGRPYRPRRYPRSVAYSGSILKKVLDDKQLTQLLETPQLKPSELKTQDFELIQLLIEEATAGTPVHQEGELDRSFKARFQSFIDQIPSHLHSVGKEGFFTHFFFGSFSILQDTQIAGKLGIKDIYFRFDDPEVLKVAVIKDGGTSAIDNIKLFSILEPGSESKGQFTSGELEGILESQGLAKQDIDKIKESRSVLISKGKEGISVAVEPQTLDRASKSSQDKFSKIEKGLWVNPEGDIAKLASDKAIVKEYSEKVLKEIGKVHSRHKNSLSYAKKAREAAHHGFVAGIFINFRYRYNIRIRLEPLAGKGYADIILTVHGPDGKIDAIPIIIELKAAADQDVKRLKVLEEKSGKLTPEEEKEKSEITKRIKDSVAEGLKQAKDYAKAPIPVLTASEHILCAGLNLDSTEGFKTYVSPPSEREFAPMIQKLLEVISGWNGQENTKDTAKREIKTPLDRIYYTLPGTGEKKGSYFSRFFLGQLLLADEFKKSSLTKSIFSYSEYPLESKRLKNSRVRPVTTFVLTKGSNNKEVFIFHIREGGKGERSNKRVSVPAGLPEQSKITEVYISLDSKRKSDFFSIDEVTRYDSLSKYQEGRTLFEGELKNLDIKGLGKTFDEALNAQRIDQSQTLLSKYKELMGKLGEAVFPAEFLTKTESHTQAVLHGAFSYYRDLKWQGSPESRVLVFPEFQTGKGKRVDMLIHVFKVVGGKIEEHITTVLEIKGPRKGATAKKLGKEAREQIEKWYEKGVYKTITSDDKVYILDVVCDAKAKSSSSFFQITSEQLYTVDVIRSSKIKDEGNRAIPFASKEKVRSRLYNRGREALRLFGKDVPDWVFIGRDRVEDWNWGPHTFLTTDDDVREHLNKYEKLTDVDLSSVGLENAQVEILNEFLGKNKGVINLDLYGNNLKHTGVETLIGYLIRNDRKMSRLILSNNEIVSSRGPVTKAIKSLASLIEKDGIVHLEISDIGMRNSDFKTIFNAFKKNTSTKILDLSDNKIKQDFKKETVEQIADVLYEHQELTSLNLDNTGITNSVIKNIMKGAKENHAGKTPVIKELYIADGKINAVGMDSLAEFVRQAKNLESLRLSGNPIGRGVEKLINILKDTNISTLELSNIFLECNEHNTESIATMMGRLVSESKVSTLDLSHNGLDAKAILSVIKASKETNRLKKLNLSGNDKIGEEIENERESSQEAKSKTLEEICEYLKGNSALESLSLADMELSDVDLARVVGALKGSNIQSLDISGNEITGNTIGALSVFLGENSKIKHLNMAGGVDEGEADILHENMEKLLDVLKSNKTLTHLDISNYELDDISINDISEYLKENTGLLYFSLAGSQLIGDPKEPVENLFKALKDNKGNNNAGLLYLDIMDIQINDETAEVIIRDVKDTRYKLQALIVSVDGLSEEKKKELKSIPQISTREVIEVSNEEAGLGCAGRRKRNIGMGCVDSRDEESIEEQKSKEQLIKESFGSDEVRERVEKVKFYGQLSKVSQQISKGETIDEAFIAKIRNIDLDLIDPEIKDIVKEIKDNIENREEIKNILRRPGAAEKIGKVADRAGLAFTAFLVGTHIANGNVEGLKYDALNLWVMPKIGEKISKIMSLAGEKYGSQILKGAAPCIGRTVGNLFAYKGLWDGIQAWRNATDPVDIKMADLNIATNSIFIAADAPAIAAETMSAIGMEVGAWAEFAGPVGAAVAVTVIIVSQFIEAGLKVEKLAEQIKLTDQEKHDFYWKFFFGGKVPDYIGRDIKAENFYTQHISGILNGYGDYDKVAMSLPSVLVNLITSVGATNSRTKRQYLPAPSSDFSTLGAGCNTQTRTEFNKFVYGLNANIVYPFYNNSTNYNSRIIPGTVGNYTIICGPHDVDVTKQSTKPKSLSGENRNVLCGDASWDGKYKNSSSIVEKWFVKEYVTDCNNVVLYSRSNSSGPVKMLFHMSDNNASINVASNYTIDVIFNGYNIQLSSNGDGNQSFNITNRYYFTDQLNSCEIHKPGVNFFYIAKDNFVCNLGAGQSNTVVIQGNFTDSENIHSIIGSNKTNHIEVSHADYVDGKGGGDVIWAKKNFTTIKGYFGDSIRGNGLVLLPINFNDIGNITYANNTINIYNKSGNFISVDKQTSVRTADGLFVTPTKVDNKTSAVTNLHVTKSIGSDVILDDELNNLRKIDNPNFNITKQLSSTNYHSTIGSFSNHIFYPDKEHHNFYWEAPSNISHLYLFDKRNANITIAGANGILDFSQLNCTLNDVSFTKNDEEEIKINKNDLHVTLLPDYEDVTVTFDGKEYYKLQGEELERDYCSHSLEINGRFSINGTDLLNHHNCFTFDSDKVLFLKRNNDLLLLSGKGALSISGYYSSVHKNWGLSIELNDGIMEPEEFRKRANNPSSFRYYQINNQPYEQEFTIFHNQPTNKHQIALLDLRGWSILDFNLKYAGNDLMLYGGKTSVKMKNYNTYQPAKEAMFVFNDTMVCNLRCIIGSTCNPEREFNGKKSLWPKLLEAVKQNNSSENVKLANEIYTLGKELFGEIIKRVVNDTYATMDTEQILSPMSNYSSVTQSIQGYIAVFDAMEMKGISSKEIFSLARHIDKTMRMSNNQEGKSDLERIKSRLPESVRNVVFSSEICIKNVKSNEYLSASTSKYDKDKRRVFASGKKDRQSVWKIEPCGDNFYIMSVQFNESWYASTDDCNSNKKRHEVFASGKKDKQSVWRFGPYGDSLYIKGLCDKYLCADHNENQVVPAYITQVWNKTNVWKVEDCTHIYEGNKTLRRRRRHHHGDHLHHNKHLSRKPLAMESNDDQPKAVVNNASKESLLKNYLLSRTRGFIRRLFNSKAIESGSSTPNLPNISQIDASIDVNGTIVLLDLFIRKVTGQKYTSLEDHSISELEARGYALSITAEFEKVLKDTAKRSGISVNESFDSLEVYKAIEGKIMSGKLSKIPTILYSAAEEAYPKNEKFLSILKSNIEEMLDEQKIGNNRHSSNQVQNMVSVNGKVPLSSLNNIAIEPANNKSLKGITSAG